MTPGRRTPLHKNQRLSRRAAKICFNTVELLFTTFYQARSANGAGEVSNGLAWCIGFWPRC